MRQLAFNLFEAKVIDKESLLDLLEPPMKQLLKDRLKKMEDKEQAAAEQKQQQAQAQAQAPKPEGKPDLKKVG